MTNEEKLKIIPYLDHGRWYQIFIENDSGTYKVTTGDNSVKDVEIDGNILKFPKDFILVSSSAEIVPDSETTGAFSSGFVDGLAAVTLPQAIDHATVFVYGYFL